MADNHSPSSPTITRLALLILLCAASCNDRKPPGWQPGDKLRTQVVTAHCVKLKWNHARDNVAVTGYRLFKGKKMLAVLGSDSTAFDVENLSDATSFTFRLEAFDAAGNRSEPLRLSVATPDGTPPVWPEDAKLDIEESRAGKAAVAEGKRDVEGQISVDVDVSWPAASDNIGVSQYRLRRGDALLAALDAGTTEHRLESQTDPDGLYAVEACDGAGNCSPPIQKEFLSRINLHIGYLEFLGLAKENKVVSNEEAGGPGALTVKEIEGPAKIPVNPESCAIVPEKGATEPVKASGNKGKKAKPVKAKSVRKKKRKK
jgi:hypothetical protein